MWGNSLFFKQFIEIGSVAFEITKIATKNLSRKTYLNAKLEKCIIGQKLGTHCEFDVCLLASNVGPNGVLQETFPGRCVPVEQLPNPHCSLNAQNYENYQISLKKEIDDGK